MATTESKIVLVLGASGYIGNAVARAFSKAGYFTIGSIRPTSDAAETLASEGIQSVVGTATHSSELVQNIESHATHLDVIVIATEDRTPEHFEETIGLLNALARLSNAHGTRPLVIYSSGCKDYGPGKLDGEQGLHPDTEDSPLNTPPTLAGRTQQGLKLLAMNQEFDTVLVRPTNVHGYSSSYYGQFIFCAQTAVQKRARLTFPGSARTILHSVHVDDCADAYVALANHPNRGEVAGEIFNISAGKRYETLSEVATALGKEFQLEHTIECETTELSRANVTFAWSQWVDSEKIRKLTNWANHRPLFAEDIARYRKEYEDAIQRKDRTAIRLMPSFESSIEALIG